MELSRIRKLQGRPRKTANGFLDLFEFTIEQFVANGNPTGDILPILINALQTSLQIEHIPVVDADEEGRVNDYDAKNLRKMSGEIFGNFAAIPSFGFVCSCVLSRISLLYGLLGIVFQVVVAKVL